MSSKFTIEWRSFARNTLKGFATIWIVELRMVMHEVAVHEKSGKAWAQPPAGWPQRLH